MTSKSSPLTYGADPVAAKVPGAFSWKKKKLKY